MLLLLHCCSSARARLGSLATPLCLSDLFLAAAALLLLLFFLFSLLLFSPFLWRAAAIRNRSDRLAPLHTHTLSSHSHSSQPHSHHTLTQTNTLHSHSRSMATRRPNGNGAAADSHGDGDALVASLTQRLLQLHESQQDHPASSPHSSNPSTLPAPAAVASLRQRLRALLTIRPADPPLSPSVQSDIDRLLQLELKCKSIVHASALPRVATSNVSPTASRSAGQPQPPPHLASLSRVSLWRGDITALACDAVVNAANSGLRGCFQPTHRCIDNVLHDAAGPGLRAACHALMEAQGHEEREGRCKVTPAFSLPARFVLHTVGPFVDRDEPDEPTQRQADQLAACYTSCLDAAEATGSIASVAFCCISTGLFGYPQQEAAALAVRSVLGWLSAHPAAKVQHVIFDVFTDADERIYQRILAAMVDGFGTAAAVAPAGSGVEGHPAASSSVPSSAAPSSVSGFPVQSTASPAVPPHVRVALDVARDIVAATAIAASPTPQLPEGVDESDLETAAGWLRSAGGLLLCGGAGLSAAAGLDYTSSSVLPPPLPRDAAARLPPLLPGHREKRLG